MNTHSHEDHTREEGIGESEDPTRVRNGGIEDQELADLTGGKAMVFGILFMLLGCLFWAWFAYVSASRVSMLGVIVVGWMTGLGVKRAAVGLGPQFMAAFIAAIGIPIGLAFVTIAINVFIDGFPWDIEGIIGKTRRVFMDSMGNFNIICYYLVCIGSAFILPADWRSSDTDKTAASD
jgi:hypothetical protein